jgi:hypothetical protein
MCEEYAVRRALASTVCGWGPMAVGLRASRVLDAAHIGRWPPELPEEAISIERAEAMGAKVQARNGLDVGATLAVDVDHGDRVVVVADWDVAIPHRMSQVQSDGAQRRRDLRIVALNNRPVELPEACTELR